MSRIRFARRNFLRGAGGATLALPLLSSLGCSEEEQKIIEKVGRAQQRADAFPKRFVFMYTPNGNYTTPDQDLSGYWSELLPIRQKLSVLLGLDLAAQDQPPGEPHQQGMALLTGRKLNDGTFVGGDGSLAGWASGISLDQEIANHIGTMTKRKTLNLGVQSTAYGGTEVRTIVSYLGSDLPVANETDPYTVYNELFANLEMDPVAAAKLRRRRRSVLDVVDRRYDGLLDKISKEDREKVAQHLDSVREVEKRLDASGGVLGENCQKPELGEPVDINDPANYGIVGRLQTDLLVMALSCDLTRVATLQWSAATNNRPYPFLQYNGAPIMGDEHQMGHMPDSDTASWEKIAIIRQWNLQQFRYLVEKLDAIPEGEGTMLDNTVVVLGSEIVRGNTHSHIDQHFLIAGGGGGTLKQGQYLSYGERPHNDLLLTILHAMGIEATEFGDPGFTTGPLSELLV